MRYLREVFIPFMLLSLGGTPLAATITTSQSNNITIILIKGELKQGDQTVFAKLEPTSNDTAVVFDSIGGNLIAGLEIGRAIRTKEYLTVVSDNASCFSACALAWLGGKERLAGSNARIGFHAAYRVAKGRKIETGVGNALVGAYLHSLGLSDNAIVFITSASPNDIRYLSFQAAEKLGIAVSQLPSSQKRQQPPSSRQEAKPSAPQAPSANQPEIQISGLPSTPQMETSYRAVFYEEDTSSPKASPIATIGSARWKLDGLTTESVDQAEKAVVAHVQVPNADLTMKMTMRRNRDTTLPASHIIEVAFTTREGDEGRIIRDIGLVQFKNEEAARGSPVAGLPSPISPNLFFIGLSNLKPDLARNARLFARHKWIDLPIRMASGRRAILSFETGPAGLHAINTAFDRW